VAASFITKQIKTIDQSPAVKYDVFISYSHKSSSIAKELLEGLEKLSPQPKIFFDYHELRAGEFFG